jgi:enoyl-CoA hydratase/carnithine racemase
MGACAMLPRIVGQGRAAELLYTGRALGADEGLAWGFWNGLHAADALEGAAMDLARRIAAGPTFAHMMTKTQLNLEWNMGLEQAIEAEAQAQAICMQTEDFRRAYRAFAAKEKPFTQAKSRGEGGAPPPAPPPQGGARAPLSTPRGYLEPDEDA